MNEQAVNSTDDYFLCEEHLKEEHLSELREREVNGDLENQYVCLACIRKREEKYGLCPLCSGKLGRRGTGIVQLVKDLENGRCQMHAGNVISEREARQYAAVLTRSGE